jgi:hypothetical protein
LYYLDPFGKIQILSNILILEVSELFPLAYKPHFLALFFI